MIFVGRDVIAQAQSGTGKTATFSIAILQQIDIALKECQALVLAPTRELAMQVSCFYEMVIKNLEKHICRINLCKFILIIFVILNDTC